VLAAEVGDEARPLAVALDRLLDPRRIQILTAAADRAQREPRVIQELLEDLRRLLQVLRHVVLERLQAVVAIARSHLDAGFRMRRRRAELTPSLRPHLSPGSKSTRGDHRPSPAPRITTVSIQPPLFGFTWRRKDG
jgi:hypothetical protein